MTPPAGDDNGLDFEELNLDEKAYPFLKNHLFKDVDIANELESSMLYAARIQRALMNKESELQNLFQGAFIFHRSREIVSGDFHFFVRIKNKIVLAAADCTGHGIPGAMLSVLGLSLLNQIVHEENHTNPSIILQLLNTRLRKTFGSTSDNVNRDMPWDGMDIALAVIDKEKRSIEFSGAFRDAYLIRNGKIIELNGSRYPIGGLFLETIREYPISRIDYEEGDKLYLFTDGFADQFGGPKNKKFMIRKFKELIIKVSRLSMSTQRLELSRILFDWQNYLPQTDDILVVGVAL
jgi:serine phosphatase RsbU (regulator of sigma subunit)